MKFMKKNGGFTLVELIVVIAILAILAGVAVPAYSGYVEKANKQADITLASEIKHALTLAYYDQKLSQPTSVVVYHDEASSANASNDEGRAAMAAVFGDEWENMHLAYSGWAGEMGPIADGNMINYVNNSTFSADKETLGGLLEDVEHVVGVLSGAIEGGSVNVLPESGLGKFLTEAGIEVNSSNAQEISNAAVMYTASKINGSMTNATAKDTYAQTWATIGAGVPNFSGSFDNDFAALSASYAYVEALAKYVDSQPNSTTNYVSQLRDASQGATGSDAMTNALNSVYGNIVGTEANMDAVSTYFGITDTENLTQGDLTKTPAYTDAMAFVGYMQGISTSSDSLMGNTDLKKENYYTDGQVLDYVTNYVSIGQSMQDMGVDATNGAFVIYFNGQNAVCMPLDY